MMLLRSMIRAVLPFCFCLAIGIAGAWLGLSGSPHEHAGDQPLHLLKKPRASYTEEARVEGTEGSVRLRVTFLADGQIGSVSPVSDLPNGLTEEAIKAAQRIEFEPARRNGAPINVVKTVEYTFSIY